MTTQPLDKLARQITDLQQRIDALQHRASKASTPEMTDALAELGVSLEELRVAQEELRVAQDEPTHNSELIAAAEAAAMRDRRRYLDLFELAPDGYLVTTRTGLIIEANQAAARLLNRPAEWLARKPIFVYLNPAAAPTWRVRLLKLTSLDGPVTFEDNLLPRGSKPVEVEFTVAPGLDLATGRVNELRWRLHDIGPRKQAERELSESRHMLRELSARLQVVREDERTRIARQVHDELGGSVTAIKLALAQAQHRLAAGNPAGARASTDEASHITDDLMNQVRHIATELRPALLDELGLAAAVEWQLQDFQKRTGIETRLSASGKSECPPGTATVLFRVLQELLTNVARHAEAQHVKVRLSQPRGHIVLEVRDDGRGITEADTHRSTALGILGIHERVEQLGGTFSILPLDHQGTVAQVTVPLPHKA
jgi:signal transduction histidine kinase